MISSSCRSASIKFVAVTRCVFFFFLLVCSSFAHANLITQLSCCLCCLDELIPYSSGVGKSLQHGVSAG